MPTPLWTRCAAETIGTFFLVLVCAGAVATDAKLGGQIGLLGQALAAGGVVMAMIYAIGDTSGAHMNPAVTVAFWAARRQPGREVAPYLAAQIVGAALAGGALLALFPGQTNLGQHDPGQAAGPGWSVFVCEVLVTCLLMFVIFAVATGAKEKGLMAGIAIGGAVVIGMLVGGANSGGSMNPARTLGPALVTGTLKPLWLYWSAPFLGALLAVPMCRLACGKNADCCTPTPAPGSCPRATGLEESPPRKLPRATDLEESLPSEVSPRATDPCSAPSHDTDPDPC